MSSTLPPCHQPSTTRSGHSNSNLNPKLTAPPKVDSVLEFPPLMGSSAAPILNPFGSLLDSAATEASPVSGLLVDALTTSPISKLLAQAKESASKLSTLQERESMNYTNRPWDAASNSLDIYLTGDDDWDQYIQEPPSSDISSLDSPESQSDNINNTEHFLEKGKYVGFPGSSNGDIPRILSFGDPSFQVDLHAMPTVKKIPNRSRTSRSRPDLANREHVIAERKRREKINENLMALSAIVPGLKKRDKASVLTKTIEYMNQMQEKVRMLEEQVAAGVTNAKSDELRNEQSKLVSSSSVDDHGDLNIDIKVSGNAYLIKIHCFQASQGTLVKVLKLIESLHLKVVTANSVQFSEHILDLTITSQVEEGFEVDIKNLFKSLKVELKNE